MTTTMYLDVPFTFADADPEELVKRVAKLVKVKDMHQPLIISIK